jgi:hypothetical protein
VYVNECIRNLTTGTERIPEALINVQARRGRRLNE